MRALHLIGSVSPVRGGPSFAIRRLARALVGEGVQIDIATTNDDGAKVLDVPLGKPVCQDGVTYWFFPITTHLYTFSPWLSLWIAMHIRDYDIAHVHGLFGYPPNVTSFISALSDTPYVIRPVGTLGHWGVRNRRPLLKRMSFACIERPLLARAAAVHYTTEQEREEAAELKFAHRAIVIPNPLDDVDGACATGADAFLQSFVRTAGRSVVLFVGRLHPIKAIEFLLDAFSLARAGSPDAVLVLAGQGDPKYVESLRHRAQTLGLSGQVIWAGLLENVQIRSALAAASVCVLPSHSENFGIAALEAMQAGKPVIVTPGVALHREIASAGAGLVVRDVSEFAEALVSLLRNPDLRMSFGRRGSKLVTEKFSSQSVGNQVVRLYEEILSRPSSRRR